MSFATRVDAQLERVRAYIFHDLAKRHFAFEKQLALLVGD